MGAKGKTVKRRTPKRGKKAWRSIDTDDVTAAAAEKSRQERQGLDFDRVPDADLFFVDKGDASAGPSTSDVEAPAAEEPAKLSKKEAARARPLRSQAILAAAHTATPVHQIRGGVKKAQKNGIAGVVAASGGNTGLARQGKKDATRLYDLWDDGPSALSRAARKKAATRSLHRDAVRAVEVDAPGCSFNPDPEEQQEAIAVAVAAEMKKIHQQDAMPTAPPKRVDYDVEEDELALLQVDEPESEEEDIIDGAGEPGAASKTGPIKRKKTKVDRNRAARRKAAEVAQAAARAAKAKRAALANLPTLLKEIDAEKEELASRQLRRKLDKAETTAGLPPRLGKTKFEGMPLQLLTTDEVNGSLRKLKPTASLAKDRFKSLQQRGIIEPRKQINKKTPKRVAFIRGEKGETEREGHAAILAARQRAKGRA
ncbi:hypothetical protein ACKKBG_A09230 [Auxenochlorella protothecoides x Auxenochlorella symbiontica]